MITTYSPRNFDLVKSLGADAAFDYNDPECAAKIKEYTKDDLKYVGTELLRNPQPRFAPM